MMPKTGEELVKARRRAAERYYEIGMAMLKEAGVKTWEFNHKGLRGWALVKERHIACPTPTTRLRLYILAHECGHIVLNHVGSKPSHRQEFEAMCYADAALRRSGVAVPRKAVNRGRRYVARRIDQAIRLGKAKRLDREAVEWSRDKHRAATKKALLDGAVQLVDLGGRNFKKWASGQFETP